jgi:hypothetical protein
MIFASLAGPSRTAAHVRGLPQERQNMRRRATMCYARRPLAQRGKVLRTKDAEDPSLIM